MIIKTWYYKICHAHDVRSIPHSTPVHSIDKTIYIDDSVIHQVIRLTLNSYSSEHIPLTVAALDKEVSVIMQKSGSGFASIKASSLRVLVTGFGSFPGARKNPTALLVHALGGHRARLARLGIELELAVLPVNYAEVARKLEELDETLKPDAILHFGLVARRTFFSIETRALNRLSLVHCDASGARPRCRAILPGAPHAARSTFPYRQIEAAFRRGGLRSRLLIEAGDYVCNETLYLSLAHSYARAIGFIHVPRLACVNRPKKVSRGKRPSLGDVIRAALIAILAVARKLRQDLAKDRSSMSSHHNFVKRQGKGPELDPAPCMS